MLRGRRGPPCRAARHAPLLGVEVGVGGGALLFLRTVLHPAPRIMPAEPAARLVLPSVTVPLLHRGAPPRPVPVVGPHRPTLRPQGEGGEVGGRERRWAAAQRRAHRHVARQHHRPLVVRRRREHVARVCLPVVPVVDGRQRVPLRVRVAVPASQWRVAGWVDGDAIGGGHHGFDQAASFLCTSHTHVQQIRPWSVHTHCR